MEDTTTSGRRLASALADWRKKTERVLVFRGDDERSRTRINAPQERTEVKDG